MQEHCRLQPHGTNKSSQQKWGLNDDPPPLLPKRDKNIIPETGVREGFSSPPDTVTHCAAFISIPPPLPTCRIYEIENKEGNDGVSVIKGQKTIFCSVFRSGASLIPLLLNGNAVFFKWAFQSCPYKWTSWSDWHSSWSYSLQIKRDGRGRLLDAFFSTEGDKMWRENILYELLMNLGKFCATCI